jgi:hypothetical protein
MVLRTPCLTTSQASIAKDSLQNAGPGPVVGHGTSRTKVDNRTAQLLKLRRSTFERKRQSWRPWSGFVGSQSSVTLPEACVAGGGWRLAALLVPHSSKCGPIPQLSVPSMKDETCFVGNRVYFAVLSSTICEGALAAGDLSNKPMSMSQMARLDDGLNPAAKSLTRSFHVVLPRDRRGGVRIRRSGP